MSTQHPDNVTTPFFAESAELGGEDEVQEAYYAYSHLICDEQMWDCEGKEVDNYVVKKLLTKYDSFFKEHRLGKDLFLTLRVPNPTVEKAEAKVLLETLESIPRSYDAAHLFYNQDIAPIFEVILPMTASARSIDRIHRYYTEFIIKRQDLPFREGDIRIRDWIGSFKPEEINVIPLFEERDKMLDAHRMVREYLSDKPEHYRPAGLPCPVGPGDELRAGGGGALKQDRADASLGALQELPAWPSTRSSAWGRRRFGETSPPIP